MGDFPFSYRVLLLLSLMLVIAGVDRYRQGAKATKYKEYGFILLTGCIGCLIGFSNDLITSSISPDYFIYGKGLEAGEGLKMAAGMLGLQTGFSAGVIGGAACLFSCRNPDYKRLLRALWIPVGAAIVMAILLPFAGSKFDPAGYGAQLKDTLSEDQLGHFRTVWWIHTGLYAGFVLGLIVMIRNIRARKTH